MNPARSARRQTLLKLAYVLIPLTLLTAVVIGVFIPRSHSEATTITSNGWTIAASASPASLTTIGTAAIETKVSTSATSSSALVFVQVSDGSGTVVGQQSWDAQAFKRNQSRTFSYSFVTPRTGTYRVKVGIFAPAWGQLYAWNDNATTITVSGSSPTPPATVVPTATAAPTVVPTTAPSSKLPPLPANWPTTLQLGMADAPNGAAALKTSTGVRFRYQYLAGGVNTGGGWANWNPNGAFASNYIQESVAAGITPVFSYYQILQSAPGNGNATPNLSNTSTMTAYFNDVKLFMQKAGAFNSTSVVLHVEPDMWGFLEQQNADPTHVNVQVASTGIPEHAGLPNNAVGLAQAFGKLKDRYAPNVLLAYHLSVWGTGTDIGLSKPTDSVVQSLGRQAAQYYQSLHGSFDLVFSEFSDRDAGFKQAVYGDGGASWWTAADFSRNTLFLSSFVQATGKRVVMWQIPLGNTTMRAMNNSWNHYQDNRVEWLLNDTTRAHLNAYVQAGVIGFLFGRGADGATCACDGAGDGTTNPSPINGNNTTSTTASSASSRTIARSPRPCASSCGRSISAYPRTSSASDQHSISSIRSGKGERR